MTMNDNWIIKFLNKTQVGHIGITNKNQPFINPTSFWYSKNNHEIYFHSNIIGRMRFNAENSSTVCFECFNSGRLLPSNLALEMSFQYECVMVFGKIRIIKSIDEKKTVLNGLLNKYFHNMKSNKDYRPITNEELNRTSVYGIKINYWSEKKIGKIKQIKLKKMNGLT